MTIGISSPRLRIRLISAAALPSRPRLPQSTTMQPMAASVWTAMAASSTRRARTTSKPSFSIDVDDLLDAHALEVVRIEVRRAHQNGEAAEEVHAGNGSGLRRRTVRDGR